MKAVSKLTYNEAISELEEILRKMQASDADIDRLADMTRRAAELIAECKRRLVATDAELRNVLEQMQPEQQ